MKNAHNRIGRIALDNSARAYFDRFAKHNDQTHMVSVFASDGEISSVTAAIQLDRPLTAITPRGKYHTLRLGEKPTIYKGHIQIPGRKKPLRHVLAFSQEILRNGADGRVFLLNREPGYVWATVAAFLGLPATPEWAAAGVEWLTTSGKLFEMEGHGCDPVLVKATRDEVLAWIGNGVREGLLPFPDRDGPIFWPQYKIRDILSIVPEAEDAGSLVHEFKAAA